VRVLQSLRVASAAQRKLAAAVRSTPMRLAKMADRMSAAHGTELTHPTVCRRSSPRRHHPLCSGSGRSRPRTELTVPATLRSSRVPETSRHRRAGFSRVEMWRGDGRQEMSVAAPFVWRCPSTPTIAPFPHPAHRTGRATLPHPALGQDLTPSHSPGHTSARAQSDQSVVPVQMREWIAPAPTVPELVLGA
jgi:hypothetical protein